MSFFEAFQIHSILLTTLIAGFFASIISGIIGSYVVVKRIVFISGSISHSVLGGIGFSLWLQRVHHIDWLSPIHGALVAAILSALIIGWIRLRYEEREDSAIAALWSVGMASGMLFISQTPGFNVELTNYLVGNILWVSDTDLIFLFLLAICVVVIVYLCHQRFLAISFDEEQARLQGLSVNSLYILLLILIAVSIVMLVQVVGIILVLTMLTIPPAIANLFTSRLSVMMVLAILISNLFNTFGLATAFHFDWPAGATIALLAGLSYIFALSFSELYRSRAKKKDH
jgi:zinc transport system permease protein